MAGGADDTIVALSSGALPAAVAVVRTSGPDAFAAAEAIAGAIPADRRASLRRLHCPATALPIDDALVIAFPGPDTATGEDVVEYQCHGSKAVVSHLIETLVAQPGLRRAEQGEFTRRALINGRIDLTQAEGLAELLQAESEAQRKSALVRAGGGVRRQVELWRESVLALSAEAEVAIDYADEDDGAHAFDPAARSDALAGEMRRMLSEPRIERLRDGVRIVVAGPANAGKSSLVNALAGQQRAIVSAVAGTTRDLVEVPLAILGLPVLLVDTAGLRPSLDEIELIGIGLTKRELDRADILLWLGDPSAAPAHPHLLQIAAKADLGSALPGLQVSAATGDGIDMLKATLAHIATPLVPTSAIPGLNHREADLLSQCADALSGAATLDDPVLVAEWLRSARTALDQISGLSGVDQLLDALFGRFCLGK